MRARKIGFIGAGVVGSAYVKLYKQAGFDVIVYDKYRAEYKDNLKAVLDAEMLFLSLPTPTVRGWQQDQTALIDVFGTLRDKNYEGIVVVKSTVLPGTCREFAKAFRQRVVHSPEFLREANPLRDLINQKVSLVGGDVSEDVDEVCRVISHVYRELQGGKHEVYNFEQWEITEIAKYTHNDFLAVKLSFFNELHKVCRAAHVDYNRVMYGVHAVGVVGTTHTQVPGTDGNAGWGGMCFPKDTKAFAAWAKETLHVEMEVLEAAIEVNYKIRPQEMLFNDEKELPRQGN